MLITIAVGKYQVTFDDIDYQLVTKYKWRINKRTHTNYAYTTIKGKTVSMHQLIMPNENKLLVHDHIDRNGLNNSRYNLRLVSQAHNCARKRISSSNTSGYKGVSYIKSRKKYQATIQVNGTSFNLGRFATLEDAVKAYNTALEFYHSKEWTT